MQKYEIMHTRIGEMQDMIAYHAIANGAKPKSRMTFEQVMMMDCEVTAEHGISHWPQDRH